MVVRGKLRSSIEKRKKSKEASYFSERRAYAWGVIVIRHMSNYFDLYFVENDEIDLFRHIYLGKRMTKIIAIFISLKKMGMLINTTASISIINMAMSIIKLIRLLCINRHAQRQFRHVSN
jgi:hypothetical protein